MNASADRLHNFGFLIKDIGHLYTKLFEYEADHLGITLAEAKVLTYLSRNAGLNQVQLAELAGIEPMSLVRILDRMEKDNWIERRAHPTDRRARQLHLKDQAQATLDQIWELSGQVRSQSLAGFKAEERNALIGLLERVHTQMLGMLSEQTGKTSQRSRPVDGPEPRAVGKSQDLRSRALGGASSPKVGRTANKAANKAPNKVQRVVR